MQHFSCIGAKIENGIETVENGGGQADTTPLTAAVIALLIARVFNSLFVVCTQECHSSFTLCNFLPPWVISSLVIECCTVIGPYSTVWCNKLI